MIFPRLLAVAELAWTPQEKREWCDFKVRMNSHIPLLQQRGLNTFTLSDEVEITTRIRSGNRAVEVTLDCEKYPAEIRYTLDGTPPTPDASLYEAPFTVTDSTVVRAPYVGMERFEVLNGNNWLLSPRRSTTIIRSMCRKSGKNISINRSIDYCALSPFLSGRQTVRSLETESDVADFGLIREKVRWRE